MSRRHAQRRNRRTGPTIFVSLAVVLVLLGGAAALYTLNIARTFDNERTVVEDAFPDESSRPPAPEPDSDEDRAETLLLLGSDARHEIGGDIDEITGSRADAIMVMRIAADRQNVQVMSIMRDNWVPIEGYGYNKINAALAFGGVPLMVSTVENFIDSRIDHVAVVDFEGFKGLTDALGGVTVTSDVAFSGQQYTFVKGPQRLDGEQALEFVRTRMAFVDGDYQRARNQQAYMKGLISTLLSRDTLTSPTKISESVKRISPFVTVDAGVKSSYLASLGFGMRDVRSSDVRFFTSPTLGTGMEGTQSVVKPDWDGIEELRGHFRQDTVDEYVPSNG